jgi:hypothetical protein
MSTHTPAGPLLSNQSPAAEMKLPQAETVDIHGHFMKTKLAEYEMYGGNGSRSVKQLSIENDLQYGNLQKEGGTKTVAMPENLDLYVEGVPAKKSARGSNSKMETEDSLRQSSPMLGLHTSMDSSATGGTRVKIEREHNSEGAGSTRISPDLAAALKRAAGIEDMELGSAENSAVHGERLIYKQSALLYIGMEKCSTLMNVQFPYVRCFHQISVCFVFLIPVTCAAHFHLQISLF